jgi:DNA-directed RNA polymerase subunit M/transcription elongation factor TFIIS
MTTKSFDIDMDKDTPDYTDIRNLGKQALASVLKNASNVNVIEKNVYNCVSKDLDDDTFEKEYKRNIYQIVGDIISGTKLNPLLSKIKEDKIGWAHSCFSVVSARIEEQNEFIVNPFNVEEGALRCHKCNSKRVFSYAKQTRGSDESTSIFAQCVNCKSKWVV